MKIPSQRHRFDIPDDITYLNCAYMSPLMKEVRDAGLEGLTKKCRPWNIAARDFFTGSDALRSAFAELVHAKTDDIAIVPAASYGVSVAAKNLPLDAGESVMVVQDQFPSNVYPWRERAKQAGANVKGITKPIDGDWTRAVLEAIDEKVAIVALPHCHWIDGGLFNLEVIASACRDEGISLALDVTQSAGAVPLDVSRIQPDFMVAATYKWLMGPYSLALLYVSERWQQKGTPIEHNWIHRKNAENFARLVDYQDDFEPGARRFDVGERSNFALNPAAETALRRILEWGVDNITETVGGLADSIAMRAKAFGLETLPKDKRAPHYLGLQSDKPIPPDLLAKLAERKVYVSVRGSSIRVTPHLYNDERDVDRFIETLEDVL